ncbi:MAG: hypothetical protein P8M12_00585 [Flavobacteriales bacterium]|jgi:hypothetical protein|nr:hypothetical protein [Flavobacteriales bacterium]
MSRFEKIAFIQSFWNMFSINDNLNQCSDNHLDQLIKSINKQISGYQYINAILQVKFMTIFPN